LKTKKLTNRSVTTHLVICLLSLFVSLLVVYDQQVKGAENEIHPEIVNAMGKVDGKNLSNTIGHLQAYGNRLTFEKQWETAQWLAEQFKIMEMEVNLYTYEWNGRKWPNVIVKIEGNTSPEKIIMPIAHFDSISDSQKIIAPGANDNGSGVAVILEIARILKEVPMNKSVVFSIFSNEERGAPGSKAFVQNAIDDNMHISAVINLDALGYNRPNFPFYLRSLNSHKTLKHKLKAIYRMCRNYFLGYLNGENILTVAGQLLNANLVRKTSTSIRHYTDLKVKETIKKDCG
jgi:Zn-dependent M28 family amino/carboxypeptidase